MLSCDEIRGLGFAEVGQGVLISDKASLYGVERIRIGDHVRIDDFCVLSAGVGGILIGSFVHIAVYSSLIGAGKIILEDFCNLSSRVGIYSSNDDYSGATMTNPTVPDIYKNVKSAPVTLCKHVIVGSGSVVLPSVCIGDGVAVGALSVIRRDCAPFGIYAGNPARRIGERKRDLLRLEAEFINARSRMDGRDFS